MSRVSTPDGARSRRRTSVAAADGVTGWLMGSCVYPVADIVAWLGGLGQPRPERPRPGRIQTNTGVRRSPVTTEIPWQRHDAVAHSGRAKGQSFVQGSQARASPAPTRDGQVAGHGR